MKKVMKQSTMVLLTNAFSMVLLLLIGILFAVSISMNKQIQNADTNRFDLTYNANRFMNGSSYLTNEVRAYAATGERTHYDNYYNEINSLKNRDAGVAAMKDIGITSEEESMINEMSDLSNTLVPLEEDAMKSVEAGDLESASEYVFGKAYSEQISKINTIKTSFLEVLDKRSSLEVDMLIKKGNFIQIATLIFVFFVILAQILSYLLIKRRVIRPIISVQDEMIEIAGGNLSSKFNMEPDTSEIGMLIQALVNTKAELQKYIGDISEKLQNMSAGYMNQEVTLDYIGDFAPIRTSMETILSSLNFTLKEINEASDQVSSASEQVSSGAQALAQGATEQASSVEELASMINDISSYSHETASNAKAASELANNTEGEIDNCNRKMQEMNRAMVEISQTSSEIGKIVKAIEDIAFQTNILALNAAVEAARAGAAGKGFAVVADEVRNLASKSAEAAKNTTLLVESSVRSVENGAILADDTAQALEQVVSSTQQVVGIIEKIAKNASGQAEAINQITTGVDQISGVVQTNSATAEQSAAASQQMSGQSVALREMVGKFKLKN